MDRGEQLFKDTLLPEWYKGGAISSAHDEDSIDWYELPYSYVLFCYPRDNTPVCTAELKDLQKQLSDFDLPVIAASTDSPESHNLFFSDEEAFPPSEVPDIEYPVITIKEYLLTDYGRHVLLNEYGYCNRVCVIVKQGMADSIIQVNNNKHRDISYIRSLL